MKLNTDKTKYMIINFSRNYQFNIRLKLENHLLEQTRETKLLGVHITEDLTWHKNTKMIIQNSYQIMIMLHKLYDFNLPTDEMVNIYVLFIRSRLEQSAVVWNSSLTKGEVLDLERVQKVALRIILGAQYASYEQALQISGLQTLVERRKSLCLQFAKKCIKSEHSSDLFPLRKPTANTRNKEKYVVTTAHTSRLAKSAIPRMQRLLNEE